MCQPRFGMPPNDPDINQSVHLNEYQERVASRPTMIQSSKFPTTLSDLSFRSFDPVSNTNIYKTLTALRKLTLSIPNRIFSILQDADFIEVLYHNLNQLCPLSFSSHDSFSIPAEIPTASLAGITCENTAMWPLIPNERSGSWPLSPQLKAESQQEYLSSTEEQSHMQPVSAYFKSTDGHVSQWSFSTRRLNRPVLELLGSAGGSVLIDTTRRGKAYPDALRRTVPMFTSVWNRALFEELNCSGVNDFQGFELESGEIDQIESRLPAFVQNLKSLGLPLEEISVKVKRPVRCVWVAQPPDRKEWDGTFEDLAQQIKFERKRWESIGGVNILICCSASRRVPGAEMSDEGYIQGAGDDSEGWSQGLTAKIFWKNKEKLLRSIEASEDIESVVSDMVEHDSESDTVGNSTLVKPTQNLFLGMGIQNFENFDLVIDCNSVSTEGNLRVLGLGCREGKLGSKMLRNMLPVAESTVENTLRKSSEARILVTCSTGRNLSVGVVLMVLCRFYDDSGSIQLNHDRRTDKQLIKQRLAWITSSRPDANPSRTTLQAANSVLIDRPR